MKARAYKIGFTESAVVSATFLINHVTAEVPSLNLKVWLKAGDWTASGGKVSEWTNRGEDTIHITQTQADQQPTIVANQINGLPTLRFDGTNDSLSFPLSVNGLTGMTIALVSLANADEDGGGSQAEHAAIFWDETTGWGTVYVSPFQTNVKARFGTTATTTRMSYTRENIQDKQTMTLAIKGGTNDSLYVNGEEVISLASQGAIAGCQDTGYLGKGLKDTLLSDTYFSGEIAEVLIYSRALSASERLSLEAYLREKYFPPEVGKSVGITGITLDSPQTQYLVSFQTIGFTNALNNTHTQFYFDTEPPTVTNKIFTGASPYTLSVSLKPSGATSLCSIVAEADHTVISNSGNCVILPVVSPSSINGTSSKTSFLPFKNVFNPSRAPLVVRYQLASDGDKGVVKVYTRRGEEIETLKPGRSLGKNAYETEWEGTINSKPVGSGVYILTLEAGGIKIIKKAVVVK